MHCYSIEKKDVIKVQSEKLSASVLDKNISDLTSLGTSSNNFEGNLACLDMLSVLC